MSADRNVPALIAFLGERATRPHAWGSRNNDCIAFIAGAVKAQTGKNPLGRLNWSSKDAALRVLAREGGIEAALDRRFRRIAPAHARRGDIGAVADADLGLHPMVVEGDMLCAPGARGLKRVPRRLMLAAWSAVSGPDDV